MEKQELDDGIWMFESAFRDDIENGIQRAINKLESENKQPAAVGFYSNLLNQNIDKFKAYLDPSYTTPSGNRLGSSGRREIVAAFCLNENADISSLIA